MELIYKISESLKDTTESNAPRWIYSREDANGNHEFLFFIKPELTQNDPDIRFPAVLGMILDRIDEEGLTVKNVLRLPAGYLRRYDIIARHYGVINSLAGNAAQNLSGSAAATFEKAFGIALAKANVMGGLEFADKFPELSATAIDYIWQNSDTKKLGGGAYASRIVIDGMPIFLVNGFHPRQLEHFIAPGRSVIAMTLQGDTSWHTARNNLIGKTNPADALPGSIRHNLLKNREVYGLKSVSSSWNGVHLSAGPVEGLVELIRYNSDFSQGKVLKYTDFIFGRMLASHFAEPQIEKILANAKVTYNGKTETVFDLTEETDSDAAIEKLRNADLE